MSDLGRDEIACLTAEQQARLLGLRAAKDLLSYRDKPDAGDLADLAEYVVTGEHPMTRNRDVAVDASAAPFPPAPDFD